MERDFGVQLMQAWGMTEVLAAAVPPPSPARPTTFRAAHRRAHEVGPRAVRQRYRLVDDEGHELPQDGEAVGHLRVKSPWITSAYFKGEGGSAVDDQGWLKTGDVATIDADGYIALTDRSKDVIKSGGEWISSIELENVASGHPAVLQAAALGIAHPKWQERPLLVVTLREGASLTGEELIEFMRGKVASWWLPDAVEFIDQMPLTGTGKLWKLKLRERFKDYRLTA